jgi:hypothetical protein
MKIQWRIGYQPSVDAKVAFDILENINMENGGITPAAVVAEAKPKKSPLHSAFEWNDSIAAKLHRETCARAMIRHIEIIREDMPDAPMRAFEIRLATESDPPNVIHVYDSTEAILADPVTRKELLQRAAREASSFRKRYSNLTELASVIHAVDTFLKENVK